MMKSLHHKVRIVSLWAGLWTATPAVSAVDSGSNELARIKSVFVYHYAQFVQWPRSSDDTQDIRLCLVGGGEVVVHLQKLHQKVMTNQRKLSVIVISPTELPESCQMMYLGVGRSDEYLEILQRLRGKPLLTISDQEDFARQGGIIEMFVRDDKVRMKINLERARSVGLKLSSKFLRLAEILE